MVIRRFYIFMLHNTGKINIVGFQIYKPHKTIFNFHEEMLQKLINFFTAEGCGQTVNPEAR